MPAMTTSRLAYIDWMRGLACVLMFQTHCYDAWLGGDARQGKFLEWSQKGGTFPAPLFLFLAGISFALVIDKLRKKGTSPEQIAKSTIHRGAEIFAFGLLFRFQEFAISWGWAPVSDLFRVDILNTIGISIMLMGLMCWLILRVVKSGNVRITLGIGAVVSSLSIAMLTPPLWTTWRPDWLPWQLESYVNGVHNLGAPQPWLFPIFPWTAFAFAGLAVGFVLVSEWGRERGAFVFVTLGVGGVFLAFAAHWLDARPFQLYAVYDFWHSSPNFFLIRLGILLVILLGAYSWCRWGWGQWGFSPLIQLGKTSLLVYWVHIEFVYGRFTILPHRGNDIATASKGLLVIFVAMLLLSLARTAWDSRGSELRQRISRLAKA